MRNQIIHGNVLEVLKRLPDKSVNCIVTSPPYWSQRDYGEAAVTLWDTDDTCEHDWDALGFCRHCGGWRGQLGLEPTLDMYLDHLLQITAELKRVLRDDGVMFWNHGDGFFGSGNWSGGGGVSDKESSWNRRFAEELPDDAVAPAYRDKRKKCLMLQGPRLAIRMVDEQGWILRNDIIWHKVNGLPESVKDRFTKRYEHVFMFTKRLKYWFNLDEVREPHTSASVARAFRGVGDNHKYVERYGGGGGLNRPRRNIRREVKKHDIAVGRIGNFSYDDPLHRRPLHPLGKNPGDVWQLSTEPFSDAHFAVMPLKLAERCVIVGCPKKVCRSCGKPYTSSDEPQCDCGGEWERGIVLDPFFGAGTTALAALKNARDFVGIEINEEYCQIARRRIGPWLGQSRLDDHLVPSTKTI